ncbi:hypothetical protein [Neoasaia chiangmaiensis]|uniref:Uncharacterized protein n=2 Tax=Neoasaia chiangmaiensis TaxID=320497 RepID=A0A1U9KPF4_9PROT|nr:hypothetical protein [Neoasaia chiangmaiensis]AQS87686.1 hypothetical protein A0U93_06795 [Neoasaia chiangmaiensis]
MRTRRAGVPGRHGEIVMLLRTKAWLGLLCFSAAMPVVARAERPAEHGAEHVTMSGEDLELSTPCIGRVQVSVDPAMSDGVSFDASAASAAHVTIRTSKDQNESKVVIASKSCAPHALLSVLVAPNIGVSIHDSHDTHFVMTGAVGSLEASLDSGILDADSVGSLDLNMRDGAQVHVRTLHRAGQVVAGGTSVMTADHADLDAFSAQLTDSSHLEIADGRIDALTLMADGAATIDIGGTANTATVTANGTGLVAIPRMNGPLTRNGTGPVRIGPSPPPLAPPASAAAAPPAASPSGSAAGSGIRPPSSSTPPAPPQTVQAPDPAPVAPPPTSAAPVDRPPVPPVTVQQPPPVAPVTLPPTAPAPPPPAGGEKQGASTPHPVPVRPRQDTAAVSPPAAPAPAPRDVPTPGQEAKAANAGTVPVQAPQPAPPAAPSAPPARQGNDQP